LSKATLPNLLVVGAQKAGTTSLYDMLKLHSDFYLPQKEIKFFHRNEHYNKGIDWYAKHFEGYSGQKYIGDFTPDYMAFSWSAERIFKLLGKDIKIIFILRHPVQRAYSQFNFYRMHGVEKNSDFIETISNEKIDLDQSTFENWYTPANYISRSIYSPQINRFLDFYNKKNIHIAIFEELFLEQSNASIQALEHFLDVKLKKTIALTSKKSNQSQLPKNKSIKSLYHTSKKILRPLKVIIQNLGGSKVIKFLNQKVEKTLHKKPQKLQKSEIENLKQRYFSEDIQQLEEIIGREISAWK
jgi:hypothetical protein